MNRLAVVRRRLRRAVLARRRLLAALLAACAVLVGLRASAQPPAPTAPVLVAARDLPAGTPLDRGDLAAAAYALALVPDGATGRLGDLVGRLTAAPLRAGEPVTDVRLLGPGLLEGYPGRVAVPVRIGEADMLRLLRVGDRIDLVAASPDGGSAELVADDAFVLSVPEEGREAGGPSTGALVLVAVPEEAVGVLARASVSAYVSPVLSR